MSIETLFLPMTHKCNHKCIYCIDRNRYSWIPVEIDYLKTINNWDDYDSITITGGEPFLDRIKLYKIIKFISKKINCNEKFVIQSNGTKINIFDCLRLKNKLKRICISLPGITKESFYFITKSKNIKKAIRGIILVNKYLPKVNISIKIVATKQAIHDTDLFFNILSNLIKTKKFKNPKSISISYGFPLFTGMSEEQYDYIAPNYNEVHDILITKINNIKKQGFPLNFSFVQFPQCWVYPFKSTFSHGQAGDNVTYTSGVDPIEKKRVISKEDINNFTSKKWFFCHTEVCKNCYNFNKNECNGTTISLLKIQGYNILHPKREGDY